MNALELGDQKLFELKLSFLADQLTQTRVSPVMVAEKERENEKAQWENYTQPSRLIPNTTTSGLHM